MKHSELEIFSKLVKFVRTLILERRARFSLVSLGFLRRGSGAQRRTHRGCTRGTAYGEKGARERERNDRERGEHRRGKAKHGHGVGVRHGRRGWFQGGIRGGVRWQLDALVRSTLDRRIRFSAHIHHPRTRVPAVRVPTGTHTRTHIREFPHACLYVRTCATTHPFFSSGSHSARLRLLHARARTHTTTSSRLPPAPRLSSTLCSSLFVALTGARWPSVCAR